MLLKKRKIINRMKIAVCQFAPSFENKEKSKETIRRLLKRSGESFDWLVFPEMTLSGFSMKPEISRLTEKDGSFFAKTAEERRSFVSYGGTEDGYNILLTVDGYGKTVNRYRKAHLFSYAGENSVYSAGGGSGCFRLGDISVSPSICFDLRFAYHYWETANDTDIYLIIAAWPESRREHWKTLLRARAIENEAFVVGVNRTGYENTLKYSGDSSIYSPTGDILLDCGNEEGIFVTDLGDVRGKRDYIRNKFPFIKERKK